MYAKKSRFRFWPLLLILMLVLGASVGSILAKYIYAQKLKAQVTFTARLADELLLQEREAVKQADGSYKLNETLLPLQEKKGNTYVLLPGLDIPKDPFVTVENKTPIRAYLYVEVTDTTNSAITYQMASGWEKLEGVTGKVGGTVYVYVINGNRVLTNENCPAGAIRILKDDQIQVSQKLLTKDQESTEDILTFRAYLLEAYQAEGGTGDKTPADVFNAYKSS